MPETKLDRTIPAICSGVCTKDYRYKVIENISEVYDDKINYPPDTQEYVRTLFKDQARSTIQSVNESLKNFKSGEIFLSGIASLEATKKCMEMVKKEVFAISYPDINFWGGDGMVYFKINKQAVIERGVNIHRFFVIRNTSEDQRVFNDAFSKAEFKKVLLMHLDANKEADQGQFNVYITHDQLVNFRNIKPNLKKIPDISLYDSCISSEWLERAIIVGEEERVDESRVSIKREDLTLAIRIQNYFLNYSDTISIRIQSEDDVENCLERIQTLIQKKKNLSIIPFITINLVLSK